MFRDRLTYPQLRDQVLRLEVQYQPDVILIENAAPGMQLIQDLRDNHQGLPLLIPVTPEGTKLERMREHIGLMESGLVLLPKGAPWLEDLFAEFTAAYPEHDDQIDSVSQLLKYVSGRRFLPMRVPLSIGLPM